MIITVTHRGLTNSKQHVDIWIVSWVNLINANLSNERDLVMKIANDM
jgi:hypothetical protein